MEVELETVAVEEEEEEDTTELGEVQAWLSRRRFRTDGRTIGRWPRGRP
jgi:hypothetical protein